MTGDGQYVLVGVARARERWSSDLARWATSRAANSAMPGLWPIIITTSAEACFRTAIITSGPA